jgi:menaquinone-dependent protoporphyrinogen oxidase
MVALITYGSKRGGTRGLAEMVADGLRDEGLRADVTPARLVGDISGYDAVIVGGALYANRWHKDARRFVRQQASMLRQRPTYFFSSGPLDDSAIQREIRPVRGVRALMDSVGGRGHVTFGGRLAPDAKGFIAAKMAVKHAGDWRDQGQVRDWTRKIASQLRQEARIA